MRWVVFAYGRKTSQKGRKNQVTTENSWGGRNIPASGGNAQDLVRYNVAFRTKSLWKVFQFLPAPQPIATFSLNLPPFDIGVHRSSMIKSCWWLTDGRQEVSISCLLSVSEYRYQRFVRKGKEDRCGSWLMTSLLNMGRFACSGEDLRIICRSLFIKSFLFPQRLRLHRNIPYFFLFYMPMPESLHCSR